MRTGLLIFSLITRAFSFQAQKTALAAQSIDTQKPTVSADYFKKAGQAQTYQM